MSSAIETPEQRPVDSASRSPRPTGPSLAAALRHYPMVLLLPIIVLAAAGVALGVKRHPTYTASSELNVGIPDAASQATPGYVTASETLASSYSREVNSSLITTPLSHRRGLGVTQLASHLSSSAVPNSPTFYVNATGSSPQQAVSLANAASHLLRSRINASVNQSNPTTVLSQYERLQRHANQLASTSGSLKGRKAAGVGGVTASQVQRAQLQAQVAQLKAQAAANRYSTSVTQGLQTNLAILNPASSASSDRSTVTERYGLVGALAGLVIGAALAFLIARLRFRRAAPAQ